MVERGGGKKENGEGEGESGGKRMKKESRGWGRKKGGEE